ncbi:hypothetical protein HNR46_003424 [Haloferula luteola]|uniref:DUF5069 domain-containing protein n=1 Tax=Haloferula luteola TaxID=595692 RepID=A0A840VH56_9BACT|nr:DUF5069 domain-containing protein [Haloferula luteola]MBB5353170.1 hypothetical protein [Haloferula luteola]
MSSTIPLISSGVAGPLGVLHLPRLWEKVSLSNVGKLHPDYPAIGAGYDSMVLGALGIEKEAFVEFMKSKPSYLQLEAWILDQKGGALDAAVVDELNAGILGYEHKEETRTEILQAAGREDDGSILDAVNLNNLDDWAAFHRLEIAG